MDAKVTGTVDAKVGLLPRRSQIHVFLYAIGAIVFGLIACLFLWYEKPLWWVPLLLCTIFVATGMWCFFASFKSAELHNALPTEVVVSNQRVRITADPRLPGHGDFFQNIAAVFTALANQKPLPSPDALVDKAGNVNPGSEEEAHAKVEVANDVALQQVKETLNIFSPEDPGGSLKSIVQPAGSPNAKAIGNTV